MNEKIEHILADIYALDASLQEHDRVVRELVTTLLSARPDARPDAAFVRRLREELVSDSLESAPVSSVWGQGILWWLMRVAPIGAVAILLLMFVPQGTPTIEDTVSPSGVSIQSPMRYGGGGGTGVGIMAPGAAKEAPAVGVSESNYATDDAGVFSISSAPAEGVDTDRAYPAREVAPPGYGSPRSTARVTLVGRQTVAITSVSLERAGFVAAYTDRGGELGELLGVSTLVTPGVRFEGTITLPRDLYAGEVIYVMMHGDDGDGVFSPADPFITEPLSGLPIVMPLWLYEEGAGTFSREPQVDVLIPQDMGLPDIMIMPSDGGVEPGFSVDPVIPDARPMPMPVDQGGGMSGSSGGMSEPAMDMPVSDSDAAE